MEHPLQQSISDYYTSLSTEAVDEQTAWGQFALDEFPSAAAHFPDSSTNPAPAVTIG